MAEIDGDISESGLIGRLLGYYQVQTRIGVGGMGEVYRAVDTKLGRHVAIKVLPPRSVSDTGLVARFQREARLLATLNHPHIGAIYGFEVYRSEAGVDIHALILELVEGETLNERLRMGPIQLKDALVIANQIADALDAAHSKGIVHRDLKPANIKITPQLIVKVLDFGIAKAVSGDSESPDEHDGQTAQTLNTTQIGTVIGTPAFMSPEQARGEAIDKRTDIWAFGCVLYQMLTGRSAFERSTMIDTLAAIIEGEPDLSVLPPSTPLHVRTLLQRCLEKDLRYRLRDIGDGISLLNEKEMSAFPTASASRNATHEWIKWMSVAALAAAFGAGLISFFRPAAPKASTQVLKSVILLPNGGTLVSGVHELPLAVARNGSRIAYVVNEEGHHSLYVREMNSLEAHAIPGTEDAMHPFFSPDGQSIGYFAGGALQTVAVAGGSPSRICNVPGISMGGSWSTDHTIVIGSYDLDLMRVSDAGGTPTVIEGSKPAAWPEVLPDGKTVLFTTGLSAFAIIPISGGKKQILASLTNSPFQSPAVIGAGGNLLEAHVAPGYILYGQSPGVVRALPFDLASQKITGAPVSVLSSVERALNSGGVYFGVSQTGLLVYASTGSQHQLVWVDRQGNTTPVLAEKAPYRMPQISPNEKLIAFALSDNTRRSDIWLLDTETGTRRRLTTQNHNLSPTWSPDGSHIAFSSKGISEVAEGGGPENKLVSVPGSYPSGWSPDGKSLLYSVDTASGRMARLLKLGTSGNRIDKPLSDSGSTYDLTFSPDGRWILYTNDANGRQEVYIAHAPDLSNPVMISLNGGDGPVWAKNGREVFYQASGAMMSVSIDTSHDLHAGKPERLFTGHFSGESHDPAFDVSHDGRRFIMVKSDEDAILSKLTVVQNWSEELRK